MTQYEVYLVEEYRAMHLSRADTSEHLEEAYHADFIFGIGNRWLRVYQSTTTTQELAHDLMVELKEEARKSPTFREDAERRWNEQQVPEMVTASQDEKGEFIEDYFEELHRYKITTIRLDEAEGQPARDIHAGTYL
jgi:adenylyl- and sulfurtransferase ThiI